MTNRMTTADAKVELVTDAMIEAGLQEHWAYTGSWMSKITLVAIYTAMQAARPIDREGVGASPLATGLSQAEPEVSALRASIPSAHEERLHELAALEKGWNGYRAEPIRPYVLKRVRPLIALAEELGLQPWVTPLSDGGLSLERAGEDDWSLDVNPDGSFDFNARICCTWRAAPNAEQTAELFLRFAANHFRSSLASAIEARSAETVELGSARQGESAVGATSAETPTPDPIAPVQDDDAELVNALEWIANVPEATAKECRKVAQDALANRLEKQSG